MSTILSLCVIFPLGLIIQLSVCFVHLYLIRAILDLFIMCYPCVRKISYGVSVLVCIIEEPPLFHCHEIRYKKHVFSDKLPPMLNRFSFKVWGYLFHVFVEIEGCSLAFLVGVLGEVHECGVVHVHAAYSIYARSC